MRYHILHTEWRRCCTSDEKLHVWLTYLFYPSKVRSTFLSSILLTFVFLNKVNITCFAVMLISLCFDFTFLDLPFFLPIPETIIHISSVNRDSLQEAASTPLQVKHSRCFWFQVQHETSSPIALLPSSSWSGLYVDHYWRHWLEYWFLTRSPRFPFSLYRA